MNQNYIKSSSIGQTRLATKAATKQAATQKMLRSILFGIVFILSCALVPTAVKGQVVLDNKAASVANNNKAGYDGNFGRAVKVAQAFTTGTTLTCQSISVDLVMTTAEGTPAANFTVQICGATGDLPDEGNILATLSGNSNPAGAGTYTYTGTVTWAAGQNLFIVCSANTTTGAYLWVTTDANTITTSNAYTAPFRLHTTASSWGYADDFRHLFSLTVSTAPSCTAPTAYNLTGGGAYCAGGTGVEVGLANSESGVSYQLKNSTGNVGSPVSGTGAAISFDNQTVAETYTVVATKATCNCTATMTGSVEVTVNAVHTISLSSLAATESQVVCINNPITSIVYTIAGSGTGASITAGALPTGVTGKYNSTTKKFTISGTPSVSGVFGYSVTATGSCANSPTTTGTITVTALPTKPTITADKTTGCAYENVTFTIKCTSGFVRWVGNSDAPSPRTYTTPIGAIDYGRTYKCITNTSASPVCESAASTSLPTVTPKATPTGFCVTPASTTDMTTPIKTCGSEANTQYTLIYIPTGAAIKTIVGTGNALNFGPQFFPGQYKIVAKNTKSGCQVTMAPICYGLGCPTPTRMGVDESDEASEWVNIGENPVKEVLTVKFNGAVGQKVNIVLSDIQGKIVTNKEVTITQPRHTEEINMQRSATGTYILNVQQNEKIKRFTILKAQ